MSRYQSQIRSAPAGMNTQADLPSLPDERSRYIKGFLPARAGKLYLSHLLNALHDVRNGLRIVGHAWYSDARPPTQAEHASGYRRRSRLIVWYAGNVIRAFNLFTGGRWPYCVADHVADLQDPGPQIEREYMPGDEDLKERRQVRWVQMGDELFWCWSDGSRIRRIFQDADGRLHHYLAGIDAPAANAISYEDPGRIPTTPCRYGITWVDEKFRESNLTSIEAKFPTVEGAPIKLTVRWPVDRQVRYAYIYRTASGTTDYYRISVRLAVPDGELVPHLTRPSRDTAVTVCFDWTQETALVAGQTGPEIGANTPPNQASILAVHDNRLIANDRTLNSLVGTTVNKTDIESLSRVQISNLNAPTQFNVGDAELSDLGTQLVVGTVPDDEVTGLYPIGALFGIWKRRSRWALYGNSIEDWTVKYLDERGCVAPDSIAEVDNAVLWLSDDGVYAVGYDSGLAALCISREIEGLFSGYAAGSLYRGGVSE